MNNYNKYMYKYLLMFMSIFFTVSLYALAIYCEN